MSSRKRCAVVLSLVQILIAGAVGSRAQTRWPGEDVLGYGYDVWSMYASQESLKDYCLFAFPGSEVGDPATASYRDLAPKKVNLSQISRKVATTVQGSSRHDYARDLAAKAGLSGGAFFFRGAIEGSFGTAERSTDRSFYFTYMDVIRKWRVSIDSRRPEELRAMLEPQFAIDLEEMRPQELFDTYGTHYVARAILGGRADYSTVSTSRSTEEAKRIEAAVKLKYQGISGQAELSEADRMTLVEANTREKLVVVGDNSEYAQDITDKHQYNLWASGISDTSVLCDFDGEGSLRPIWELTGDESRKRELERAFEELTKEHPLPEENEPTREERTSIAEKHAPGGALSGKLEPGSTARLRSWKGDYMHRPDNPLGNPITTWDSGVGNNWTVEDAGGGRIRLRSWKGDYLHRPDNPQGNPITAWDSGVGNHWTVEDAGGGRIRLRSWKGDFLHRPDNPQGNPITAWGDGIGSHWTVEGLM